MGTPSQLYRPLDPARAAELLAAARDGCRASLRSLLEHCEPFVRGCAHKYAWRREHVDDIVQDVWLQLLLHMERIREVERLAAWLATVVRHAATRFGRRERRAVPIDDVKAGGDAASAEDDALGRCRRDEVRCGVRRALGRLGDDERTLLLLLHRDERPRYRDVGVVVGRPVGSLGPTRQRLLERMRRDDDIARLRTFAVAG